MRSQPVKPVPSDPPRRRRWSLALTAAGLAAAVAGCGNQGGEGPARPLKVLASLGEVGLSPGQFSYPRAMDADGSSLWLIDKAARVQRIDPSTGEYLGGWTMPEFDLGKPTGVTVAPGPDGEPCVYVADTHYHRVMVYRVADATLAGDAEPIASFGAYGEGPGEFIYPTDVAVLTDADGKAERIYVSEYGGNDRVSVFDAGFNFLFSFGTFGNSEDPDVVEFSRPQSMAIDRGRGELIVADACNQRIGRFTLDGRLVRWIGSPEAAGEAPGKFRYPYGVSLLNDGTALVAEFGNHRVQRIDLETGASLGLYGTAGRGEGELANPWAVAAVGETAYVLDSGNNRVLAFESPAPGAARVVAGAPGGVR